MELTPKSSITIPLKPSITPPLLHRQIIITIPFHVDITTTTTDTSIRIPPFTFCLIPYLLLQNNAVHTRLEQRADRSGFALKKPQSVKCERGGGAG